MKTVALFIGLLFASAMPGHMQELPAYTDAFNPSRGFRPAQRSLSQIYLQIAGSLEQFGSPEPYLRHIANEHARVDALYARRFGKPAKTHRPTFLTDQYLNRFSANWTALAPKLELAPFTKSVGHSMHDAILGTEETAR